MTKQQSIGGGAIWVETPEVKIVEPGEGVHIETVAESDLERVAREDKFMNEIVKIRIGTTTDPNARPFVTVCVNGPENRVQLPRGYVCGIKRMFVEVLARMWETAYTQAARNSFDPESGNEVIGRQSQAYPFEVVEDKNPLGRPWLERILAEAN